MGLRRRRRGAAAVTPGSPSAGAREIRAALGESRRWFAAIGLFSAFVNLLMLTGPLFMLQVYDRVLTSRSEATLVALIGIVAFLFLMMGLLDHARLDGRVLGAMLSRAGRSPASRSAPARGLHDLEAMQRFASGPGPFAFFDAPWTPVFLLVLFTFHWLLGVLAVFSGVLLLLALVNQARTAGLQAAAGDAAARAGHFVEEVRAGAETVRGLGMRSAAVARTGALRNDALGKTISASDRGGRVRRDLAHAAAVPAIDDAGARRVAGDPGRGDAGDHDRGGHPDGPGAGADRPGGCAVAGLAARAGSPPSSRATADGDPGGAGAHAAAGAGGAAGGG